MGHDEEGGTKGLGQRAPPRRGREASGTRLSSAPPSPSMPAPRRTLVSGFLSAPSPPASEPRRVGRSVDADWEDDDEVTHIYADGVTQIEGDYEIVDEEEEKTQELPRRAPRRAALPAVPVASVRPKVTLIGVPPPAVAPPPSWRTSGPPSLRSSPTVPPRPAPPWRQASLPPMRLSPSMPATPEPLGAPGEYTAPVIRRKEARTLPLLRGVTPSHVATAAAASALAWLVVALVPSQGKILVNVSDSRGSPVNRLEVFVDGQTTPCATAPCYLSIGRGAHEVKVIADGFEVPAGQAVAVKSGDSTAVNFMLGASSGSGIKIDGKQPGVKLTVDDKEIGPLPQVLRDLLPGDHTIRVAGSARYEPLVRHVTVERDKVEDLGTITLKVLRGNVTVRLGTPGARVFIGSGSDRRELPMLPLSLDIDTARSWSLEGLKPGFQDYVEPINFNDGVADETYTVTLEPKSAGNPVGGGPASEPRLISNTPAAPAPEAALPAPMAFPPRGAGGGTGGDGYLNINSIPSSTCILDGKSLGATPRLHVSVRAGSHRVKFRTGDGLTKTVVVNVGPGETKLAATRLE